MKDSELKTLYEGIHPRLSGGPESWYVRQGLASVVETIHYQRPELAKELKLPKDTEVSDSKKFPIEKVISLDQQLGNYFSNLK